MYNNGVILSGVEGSRAITMKTIEQKAKKVPTIRFAGFDDEWVEKKLGDEAIELIAGGDIDKAKVVKKGKFPIYANALTNDGIVGYYDDFFRVKAPAVTITGRGEVGYAKARKENFTPVVRLLSVRSNHDSDFLENAINIHNVVVESTGVPQLTVPQISSYDIFFPCLFDEEKKLGSFFSNIDSLISLEQKKYDKLTQVKKSMLEKMFPKEGATVPEIRFVGFSGDWKEKKLSDEFVDFIVPMRDKPKSFDGKIPWTRIEDIEGKFLNGSLSGQYVSEKTIAQMNLKVIPKNSLIVSSSATFGVVAVVTQDLVTNQTFIGLVPNDKESLDFWYIFFYSDKAREYMKSQSAGSTIFYIARESFENMPVMIPSREEQQTIGSYFSHLDSLISLQQRKLEKLKNIKKSLLEKMFV